MHLSGWSPPTNVCIVSVFPSDKDQTPQKQGCPPFSWLPGLQVTRPASSIYDWLPEKEQQQTTSVDCWNVQRFTFFLREMLGVFTQQKVECCKKKVWVQWIFFMQTQGAYALSLEQPKNKSFCLDFKQKKKHVDTRPQCSCLLVFFFCHCGNRTTNLECILSAF